MRIHDDLKERIASRRSKQPVRALRLSILVAAAAIAVIAHAATSSARDARSAQQFSWPGIYDLVGTGFPDGERRAVLSITRDDTAYTLESLQGPPGKLLSFKVEGDSAHIIWDLGPDQMLVDLRGSGDSLTGEWSSGDGGGQIEGSRRR